MNPEQPYHEQIVLTIDDQSKVDLVMELLSHFDLVRARRERVQGLSPKVNSSTENSADGVPTATDSDADFWALAGIWKDRDIDAQKLRQGTWQRANGSQL